MPVIIEEQTPICKIKNTDLQHIEVIINGSGMDHVAQKRILSYVDSLIQIAFEAGFKHNR